MVRPRRRLARLQALARPTLWTAIRVTGTFTNRTLVNEMLARAGEHAPLSVVSTRHRAAPTAAAAFDFLAAASDLAQHHAHRVRELGALALPSPDWVRSVAEGFAGCDVPRLERLRVASPYEGEMGPRMFAGTRRSVSLRIVRAGGRTWLEADDGFGQQSPVRA